MLPLETGCLSLLELSLLELSLLELSLLDEFDRADPLPAGSLSADLVSAPDFFSDVLESAPSPFAEPLRLSVR